MWVLLSGGLRRWLLLSLAAPVAARLLGAAGRRLQQRNGNSTTARGLQLIGGLVGSPTATEARRKAEAQRRSLRPWNR
ncbi:hypothetical protein [Kineococcus sp. SYSU DK003]|uniref:hypothetical protein n=1 Tax=Kineococcus sp. SYSU DK003 TaxID=3383124 RepID=UPI003D7F0E45